MGEGSASFFGFTFQTADDMRKYSRGTMRPSCCRHLVPRKWRGAGKAGYTLYPRSCVHVAKTKAHASIQVQRRYSDFPCSMALRLIRDRPGDRLSCHHRPLEALASSELDASTGASDPNDFTVRNGCARLSHHRVHRIPPRVSDDPDTPLVWDRMAGILRFISDNRKSEYFRAEG